MLTALLEKRVDSLRVWVPEKADLPVELGRLRQLEELSADLIKLKEQVKLENYTSRQQARKCVKKSRFHLNDHPSGELLHDPAYT